MDTEKLKRLMIGQEIIDRNNAAIDRAIARLRTKGIQPAGRARSPNCGSDGSMTSGNEVSSDAGIFKAAWSRR